MSHADRSGHRAIVMRGAVATALLAALPASAVAYCPHGHSWAGRPNIPVYHESEILTNMVHHDGTPWTEDEFTHELRWILAAINASSNSNLPPLWDAGVRTPCDAGGGDTGCQIPWSIVLVYNNDPSCYGGWGGGAPSAGDLIFFENVACDTAYYEHYSPPGENRQTMQGYLLHELGHSLGIAHSFAPPEDDTCPQNDPPPSACQTPPCAVMQAGFVYGSDAHSYFWDDILGFQSLYSTPWFSGRSHHESSNISTWAARAFPSGEFQSMFGLSSSVTSRMFMSTRGFDPAFPVLLDARRWDRPTSTWPDWGAPSPPVMQGRMGAAWAAGPDRAFYSFTHGENQTDVSKAIGLYKITVAGGAAILPTGTAGAETRRHGASTAYDPKTNSIVVVSTESNGTIRLNFVDNAPFQWIPTAFNIPSAEGWQIAYDTPTVACGDASIAHNCIVAWAMPAIEGTGSHYHYLRWMQFSAVRGPPWDVSWGALSTGSTVLHGPPTVAYKGPAGSTSAFVVAFPVYAADGTGRVWVGRKSTGLTDFFNSFSPREVRPAGFGFSLGSAASNAQLIQILR